MLGVAALATVFGSLLALDWVFLVYVVIVAMRSWSCSLSPKGWRRFRRQGVRHRARPCRRRDRDAPFWGAFALTMAGLQRAGRRRPACRVAPLDRHGDHGHRRGLMGALASAQTQGGAS